MRTGEHKDLENDMNVFVKGKRKYKALISNMNAFVQKHIFNLNNERSKTFLHYFSLEPIWQYCLVKSDYIANIAFLKMMRGAEKITPSV